MLDWYLDHLGMIVSDFLYYPGRRDRGPVMSFIRCDRGQAPADHHTLGMALGPANRYIHSAYQVSDIDAMATGGRYLAERGYHRSWGIGRHILGSQIFDYWRDSDGFLVEHFSDGDMFDGTPRTGVGGLHRLRALRNGDPGHQRLPRHLAGPGIPAGTSLGAHRAAPRQRIQPRQPARLAESGQFLTQQPIHKDTDDRWILHTADAW